MSKKIFLIRFIFIIWASLVGVSNAAAESLSAYDFMKPATNQNLVISPSGRYVAYTYTWTRPYCDTKKTKNKDRTNCKEEDEKYINSSNVVIVDIDNVKKVRDHALVPGRSVEWLKFANDDRLLVSFKGSKFTVQRRRLVASKSDVLSMSVQPNPDDEDNGDVQLPLQIVVNLLRDDPEKILVAGYKNTRLDLWKVNVFTGEEEPVASGKAKTYYWYADQKGKPKLRYDCVGVKCNSFNIFAENDKGDWRRIRRVRVNSDENIQDASFYPAAYSNNEDQILILSEQDGDERRTVRKYDFNTNSTVETVYEHPKYDVQSVLVDNRTEEYLGVTYIDDRRRFDFVDDELDAHFETIDRHFNGETNITFIGQNSNGNRAIIYSSSYKSPGGYYIYDFKSKKVQKLISTEMELESGLNSDGDIMRITMRDGSKISAYHYYPKGQKKGAPLLVMPHGGPHVRDSFGFDYWAQYFVSKGYQVVSMNFRGSSGYGKAFEEAGHGEWGGLMQDDITDTVKYFHSQKIAAPDKTCIVGFSYGGYAALYGGATTPELYQCIVSGAGVSDLVLSMSDDKRNLSKEGYEVMTKSMGDPKVDKARLIEKSPLKLAHAYEDPVLLLHGTRDKRVEAHHSRKMYKALQDANKTVNYIELEEVGHNGWPLKVQIEYLEAIDAFLSEHIGVK